jgi:hypothetical protein
MYSRAGAEVKRMRSMWDSIETHCWPIDKLAAIVISSKAYWKIDQDAVEYEKQLTISDVLNITRAPPTGTKDQRGLRTKNYAVVGFSHKVPYYRYPRNRAKGIGKHLFGYSNYRGKKQKIQDGWRSVWFVLKKDGAIIHLNTHFGSARYQLCKKEKSNADIHR